MSLPSSSWTLIPDAETPGETLDRATRNVLTGVDWALDLDTGDLIFPLRYTTGLEAVAQGIRIRLLNFKGEWFFNLDDGVPWLAREGVPSTEALLGQAYDRDKTSAALRKAIAAAPYVTEINKLDLFWEGTTRTLRVSFAVRSTFGVVVVDELEF